MVCNLYLQNINHSFEILHQWFAIFIENSKSMFWITKVIKFSYSLYLA